MPPAISLLFKSSIVELVQSSPPDDERENKDESEQEVNRQPEKEVFSSDLPNSFLLSVKWKQVQLHKQVEHFHNYGC